MGDIQQILYAILIIFFASMIQGAVGFGFALIAAPVLSLVLPVTMLVPVLVMCSLMINIMVASSARKHIALKEIWVLVAMGILGIPVGVYGLKTIDPGILKFIMAVIIIGTSWAMYKGFKINMKNKMASYGIAGFISGFLNGSISMSGPPIVLFLTNEGYEKDRFRANITAYGVMLNIVTIITLGFYGLLNREIIQYTGVNLIAILAGTFIGIQISKKLNEGVFRRIILILLMILGISTGLKTIIG